MANTIIKGDELMVFLNNKSIAYATNHTLELSGETTDVSSKDHGVWNATTLQKISWSATTENLYTDESYDSLFSSMVARQPIDVVFGHHTAATSTPVDDPTMEAWTPLSGKTYAGKAYITTLSLNAQNGDNATYTATFTGCSELKKTTA